MVKSRDILGAIGGSLFSFYLSLNSKNRKTDQDQSPMRMRKSGNKIVYSSFNHQEYFAKGQAEAESKRLAQVKTAEKREAENYRFSNKAETNDDVIADGFYDQRDIVPQEISEERKKLDELFEDGIVWIDGEYKPPNFEERGAPERKCSIIGCHVKTQYPIETISFAGSSCTRPLCSKHFDLLNRAIKLWNDKKKSPSMDGSSGKWVLGSETDKHGNRERVWKENDQLPEFSDFSQLLTHMLKEPNYKPKFSDVSTKKKRREFSQSTKNTTRTNQKGKCAKCNGYPNTFHYHHKGSRSDNSLENCQALCPNCHDEITRKERKDTHSV